MSNESSSYAIRTHPPSVLLIDDQAMVGEAVRRLLADEKDIAFHYCSDPRAALGISATVNPTVILQDLVMPQMDGLALVRLFRASPHTRDIPLIVLSTEENPKVKAEAFACGANDYIVKLPDKLELIARIRYHSRAYISLLERNEAFGALIESQKQLEIRNRFIRETFGRYLSDEVVSNLLETPEGLNLGGEKRELTVMMTDLRGFTSFSETLPAEDVVALLNNYLEVMTGIIAEYGGTINEIIGDGMLVLFGAPLVREDHAERAVACAVAMQLGMAQVNERSQQLGLPPVAMGIGVNTGEAVVGNIGSQKRAKYTVVGRNVNLVSRIESYTAGDQIMVSQSTRDAVSSIASIQRAMEVMPKGVKEPIWIYELTGIAGAYNLHLPQKRLSIERLTRPIRVRYSILDEKQATDRGGEGMVSGASEQEFRIEGAETLPEFTNLKIQMLSDEGTFVGGPIYGKVRSREAETPLTTIVVRLTAVPAECAQFVASFHTTIDTTRTPTSS